MTLKPVFGTLSNRIGVKPVIVGGLLCGGRTSGWPECYRTILRPLRLVEGPGLRARSTHRKRSHSDGRIPPSLAVLAICATAAAIWVASAIPPIATLPRKRSTVADLAGEIVHADFLVPVAALGLAAGALGVVVGFLPLVARTLDLNPIARAGMVTIVAIASAAIQPAIGGRRDRGRISVRVGADTGSGLIAVSLLAIALLPHRATLIIGSALGGIGIGAVTALEFAAGLGAMAGVASFVAVAIEVAARNPTSTRGLTASVARL